MRHGFVRAAKDNDPSARKTKTDDIPLALDFVRLKVGGLAEGKIERGREACQFENSFCANYVNGQFFGGKN